MTLATVPRYDPDGVSTVGGHAVVVGGSVAGLVTARVLADAFETVTVLEKDTYPQGVESRRGVPQGSHIHALQEAGRATFEDLLPGYGEDLLSAGALMLDATTDLLYYDEGAFVADGTTHMPMFSATRPLFERTLRRRVADVDGVDLRQGRRVTEFLTDGDGTAVTGVSVRGDGGGPGHGDLAADLVVDATGRTSYTSTWLADNGYDAPRVEEVTIDVAYSTTAIERPPDDRRAILQVASAPDTRGCAAFPVEGDRWLVNLHGVHDEDPPGRSEDFASFASTLPVPQVERLLDRHDQVWTEPDYYPYPSSRRRYYEELDRFPEGLVVVGDAIASFNPIYGQGMSVAALEALELHHALAAGGREDLALRYFERAAGTIDVAWSMAVGADHQFPETTGPKPRGSDLFSRYFSRVVRTAHRDGRVRDELMRVIGMERPPTHLLRPGVAGRVLKPDVSLPAAPWRGHTPESARADSPGTPSR